MLTCDQNQWPAEWLNEAFRQATEAESIRRAAINEHLMSGLKLSTRLEAVARDIRVGWLNSCLPAGSA